jgi:dTDP-4-dehydrorhamnose 3,5-epimerase
VGVDSEATDLAVHVTAIQGLLVVDLVVHSDGRGWFKESYQQEKLEVLGLPHLDTVQHNVSFNAEVGVTRGIHAEPWEKYISPMHGTVFVAIVDLRAGAEFGRVVTVELSPARAIFVPRGCGNAYQTLEPDVVYSYLVNGLWSPVVSYTAVNLFDPELAIPWPISEDQAICSARDRSHPGLSEIVALAANEG